MYKVRNVNIEFFRKKKSLVLITTAMIGASFVTGSFNKTSYGDYNGFSEPKYEDAIIWSKYIPEKTETVAFTYHPSNSYKVRAFPGKSLKTHYRIEIIDLNNTTEDPIEYTEWMEIPKNGLITINRSDFSDNQYNHDLAICYDVCNVNRVDDMTDNEERTYIYASNCTKKDVENYNKFREKMKQGVREKLKENDSEFDKIKKTYDYIIKNIAYDHDAQLGDKNYEGILGIFYTDCTGYADMLNYVLQDIGIESFSAMDNTNGHIWNIVKINDKYYHLDARYSDTGSFTNTSKYRYFLVSDEFMHNENRWWVPEKDVTCNEMYDLTNTKIGDNVKYRNSK